MKIKISDTELPDMLDITAPEYVEVLVRADRKVMWVNVNGMCRFRACRIGELTVTEEALRVGVNK